MLSTSGSGGLPRHNVLAMVMFHVPVQIWVQIWARVCMAMFRLWWSAMTSCTSVGSTR